MSTEARAIQPFEAANNHSARTCTPVQGKQKWVPVVVWTWCAREAGGSWQAIIQQSQRLGCWDLHSLAIAER